MAKLFGCPINVGEEDGGGSIPVEVSRSGNQPDGEAISSSTGLPPVNQRESNQYYRFLDSTSNSGSVSTESESDLHHCFIDFFDRESYIGSNQRLSTSCDWGIQDMEEEIELGLRIGSGSGSDDSGELGLQVSRCLETDSGRVETDSGRVEFDSGRVEDDIFVEVAAIVDEEELEWEESQNGITWASELVQTNLFSLEEEEDEEEEEEEEEEEQEFEWLVGSFEEDPSDIMMDTDIFDIPFGVFLSSENNGNYEDVLARSFDESGAMGSPPASKSVVDELPVVELTSEELSNGSVACAICKDEIVVEEKVMRLPCRHYYHGECIVTWLGIRNTCPVCRYELPTDDLEYERNRRSQRRGLARDLV